MLESGTKPLHFLIIREVSIKGGSLAFVTFKIKIKRRKDRYLNIELQFININNYFKYINYYYI